MTETIKTAKELCRYYMAEDIPTITLGPPGVGKSEMWKQLADEQGIGFKDLRLGQMDPVDLRGLPRTIDDFTTWVRPDFWPVVERDGPKGIILFDELPDTTRAMQSAAYQIILDGRAGPHVIPPGWHRCAAGNRREDKAAAMAISTALANRLAWITIEADKEAFIEYCYFKKVNPLIPAFIRFRPKLLHSMEGQSLTAFPSPRSWFKAARICGAPKEYRVRLMAGLIGDDAAGEFEAHMRCQDLPDIEDIIKDPKGTPIPKEPSLKYAIAGHLSAFMNRDNIDKVMTYIKRSEFGRDFEICCTLDATKRDATLTETRAFVEFGVRNKDLKV